MENASNDNSFNLYNIINKFIKNIKFISTSTLALLILALLYFVSLPTTYKASIEISENTNIEFNLDERLNKYFIENDINSKLVGNNFIKKIKNFSIYKQLATQMKSKLKSDKIDSLNDLSEYDFAKYLYDGIKFKKIQFDSDNVYYDISYTSKKLNAEDVRIILENLVSLALKENILDIKKDINNKIDYYVYRIKTLKENHNLLLYKKEVKLKLEIDKKISSLNYDKSKKVRELKEQIVIAKNLGFYESQLENVDVTSDLINDLFIGDLPENQFLNLPLYFFGSKILEEELKNLESNNINVNTIGNFGAQELLAELDTVKYQNNEAFIENLIELKTEKDELLLLESFIETAISNNYSFIEYNFESIDIYQSKKYDFTKLFLLSIILSFFINTLLILYKDEHEARFSKPLVNK